MSVASRRLERARDLAALTGAPHIYADYRELLADPNVDAVLTAVPIPMNAPVLVEAIAAGKHVIAEKPLAANIDDGKRVLEACARTSKIVLIAENYRYRPDLAKTRALIESGVIGEVFAFQLTVTFDMGAVMRKIWTEREWRKKPEYPGGFLLDAGVHPISFLRDLLGEVSELFARTLDREPLMAGPDGLLMQLTMAGGVEGHYMALYTAKVKRELALQLCLYGSRGTIEVVPGSIEWSFAPGTAERVRVSSSDRGYRGQWINFIEAIENHAPVVSTPSRALGDIEVISAALRSASEGRPVRLRP